MKCQTLLAFLGSCVDHHYCRQFVTEYNVTNELLQSRRNAENRKPHLIVLLLNSDDHRQQDNGLLP